MVRASQAAESALVQEVVHCLRAKETGGGHWGIKEWNLLATGGTLIQPGWPCMREYMFNVHTSPGVARILRWQGSESSTEPEQSSASEATSNISAHCRASACLQGSAESPRSTVKRLLLQSYLIVLQEEGLRVEGERL